jgi:hypothetical protein
MRWFKLLFICLLVTSSSTMAIAQSLPDLIIQDMWTDLKIVLVNQEFTIGYATKNHSSVSVPKHVQIHDNLYINGNYHASLSTSGANAGQSTRGNHKIALTEPGTHTLKITVDSRRQVRESNEWNNAKEIEIKVHDYNTYLADCMAIHSKAMEFIKAYERRELTTDEFRVGINVLANYSDHLARLSSQIKPQAGLEQFDRYIMVGTKKLSTGLWNIWVGLVDYGKDFTLKGNGQRVVIPLGDSYIEQGKSMLEKAEVDLLVAVSVLLKSMKGQQPSRYR